MSPIHPLVAALVARLSPELCEDFEERAGVMEFDAALPRDHAECLALLDVLQRHPYALTGMRAFQVKQSGRTQYVVTADPRRIVGHFSEAKPIDLAWLLKERFGGLAFVSR